MSFSEEGNSNRVNLNYRCYFHDNETEEEYFCPYLNENRTSYEYKEYDPYCKCGLQGHYEYMNGCKYSDEERKRLKEYYDFHEDCYYDKAYGEFQDYSEKEYEKEEHPETWTPEDEEKLKSLKDKWEKAEEEIREEKNEKSLKYFGTIFGVAPPDIRMKLAGDKRIIENNKKKSVESPCYESVPWVSVILEEQEDGNKD